MKAAPMENYEEESKGLWGRLKERFGWGEFEDEEDVEFFEDPASSKDHPILRVRSTRVNHVSVWLSIQSFDDAQHAADGLKEGHQQIVNLEKAAPEICTRVIDFLNGVIYALDGFVEKVGEKVYLFTPSNYVIEVEDGGASRKVQSPFREN